MSLPRPPSRFWAARQRVWSRFLRWSFGAARGRQKASTQATSGCCLLHLPCPPSASWACGGQGRLERGDARTILLTVAGIHLTLGLGALVALGVLLVTAPKSLIYVVVFSVLTMVPVSFEIAAIIAIRSPASSDSSAASTGLTSGAEPLDTEVIDQRAPNPTSKMRCAKCRHVQSAPLDLSVFVCEGCGARMKRRSPSRK